MPWVRQEFEPRPPESLVNVLKLIGRLSPVDRYININIHAYGFPGPVVLEKNTFKIHTHPILQIPSVLDLNPFGLGSNNLIKNLFYQVLQDAHSGVWIKLDKS
jgi:hypothetical protein